MRDSFHQLVQRMMADLPTPETQDEDTPTTPPYEVVEDEWTTVEISAVVEPPPIVIVPGPPPVRKPW